MSIKYEPKHGAGWRDAEWQTIQVFRRTEFFGCPECGPEDAPL